MTKSVKLMTGYYVDFEDAITITATGWTFTSKSSKFRVTSSGGAGAAGTVTERISTKLGSASESNIYSNASMSFHKAATSVNIRSSSASRTIARTTTDQTVTVKWYASLDMDAYFATSSEATYTIPALTKYTITYNANGGSGAPSATTKYYGQTAKLSTTVPTRANARFKGWATSATGAVAYAAGANYTANANATLYAVWQFSYGVTYNANGGSGAPASDLKWQGETYKLSSTVPTRPDFQFKGWATSPTGSAAYQPGGSYTTNAAVTFYAVWERVYQSPSLTIDAVSRADATTHELDDEGRSVAVNLTWSLFDTPSGGNHPDAVTVTSNGVTETVTTLTGTRGTETLYVDADSDPTAASTVTVTLTDLRSATVSGDSVTQSAAVPTSYFPIDIRKYGAGVAIGGPSNEDALDVFMPLRVLPRGDSTEIPLEVNDGVRSVFQTDWDGNIVAGNPEEDEWSLKVRTEGRVGNVIRVVNSHYADGQGDGVIIGDGGTTIIGSGESAASLYSALDATPASEVMYVTSDGAIYLFTNCNTIANRRQFAFGTDGCLYTNNPSIDDTGATASAQTDQPIVYSRDKNNRTMSVVRTRKYTTGAIGTLLETCAYINGSNVWNSINVIVNADGTRSYGVTDQAAFRTAIGVGQYTGPTNLPLDSACTAYSSAMTPKYMKEGRVVTVTGAVKPAKAVDAGGTMAIGTLPSGFRPQVDIQNICQGSSRNIWLLTINTSGVLSASRYRDEGGANAMSTSVWLPFHVTFIASTV